MKKLELKRVSLPATGAIELVWNSRREAVTTTESSAQTHIHPCYEIYVHICGDILFAVNDKIFPLSSGDVIVTRPQSLHRSIPLSDCVHEHYCIFLYCEDETVKEALELLADRCLLQYPMEDRSALLALLQQITERFSDEDMPPLLEQRLLLYQLFSLLSKSITLPKQAPRYPDNLRRIVEHIHANYAKPLTSAELCHQFFISQSALERLFRRYMHTTPYHYVQSVRLSVAAELLMQGKSVIAVARESGFTDYSHFIARFHKAYDMTPSQYKKAYFHG